MPFRGSDVRAPGGHELIRPASRRSSTASRTVAFADRRCCHRRSYATRSTGSARPGCRARAVLRAGAAGSGDSAYRARPEAARSDRRPRRCPRASTSEQAYQPARSSRETWDLIVYRPEPARCAPRAYDRCARRGALCRWPARHHLRAVAARGRCRDSPLWRALARPTGAALGGAAPPTEEPRRRSASSFGNPGDAQLESWAIGAL